MNQLTVNPTEFGIEENKASELIGNLPQIKSERLILERQFDEIIKMDIESVETSKKARELRLLIQKNRTQGLNVWHKTTKDYFLKGGQFVDAIKRVETAVNERMENALEEIEKYQEIKEQKRLDQLEQERLSKLEAYKDFVPFGVSVRNVSDEDFEKILTGAKMQFEAKLEADKLEFERIEKERIENEKRIDEENRLKELHKERKEKLIPFWNYMKEMDKEKDYSSISDEGFDLYLNNLKSIKKEDDERIENERLENERLKKEAEEKEKELEKQRKEAEAEKKRIEAEANARIEAERKEREKIESELKAKKEAELKAEQERLAEQEKQRKEAEKLAKAPIKKQLQSWVDLFNIPSSPVENELSTEILEKFNSFKTWASKQIDNL